MFYQHQLLEPKQAYMALIGYSRHVW